jgi:cephalosporin hydroxylase
MIKAPPEACVVGVDIAVSEKARTISHPRVKIIEGDSVDPVTIDRVAEIVGDRKGLVALDSDHSAAHVHKEMELYQRFVETGCYMVVEDTNINGHPVAPFAGPGPYEAVRKFLKTNSTFQQDDLWKKNMFSFHHWLRRVA